VAPQTFHSKHVATGPTATNPLARSCRVLAQLVAILVVAGSGCGSVSAAASLSDANDVLTEARGREAERFAPYEYTRALTYLDKAKECNGMGQYEAAGDFARESQKAAEKAMQVARLNKEQSLRRERFAPTRKDPPKPSGPGVVAPD
jgi:hypothetical protein